MGFCLVAILSSTHSHSMRVFNKRNHFTILTISLSNSTCSGQKPCARNLPAHYDISFLEVITLCIGMYNSLLIEIFLRILTHLSQTLNYPSYSATGIFDLFLFFSDRSPSNIHSVTPLRTGPG